MCVLKSPHLYVAHFVFVYATELRHTELPYVRILFLFLFELLFCYCSPSLFSQKTLVIKEITYAAVNGATHSGNDREQRRSGETTVFATTGKGGMANWIRIRIYLPVRQTLRLTTEHRVRE